MTLRSIALAAALCLASALPGHAVTCAPNLGTLSSATTCTDVLSVQTIDWIDFSLASNSGFGVTDFSITVRTTAGSNFNPVLGLYSRGNLIATTGNYGGSHGVPLTLSFTGAPALADGLYRLGIAGRNGFFTQNIANARSTAYFRNGSYTLDFATTIGAVPLPASAMLLLTALGALGFARRNRRAA